ncbi:MAG: hypothetical protein ACI970_001758 [Myxococcota bacterium]
MATKERTTKQVVDDTRQHLSELVSAHVDLAKAEVADTISQATKAIAPFAIAGILGVYLLSFYAVSGAKALELVVPEWAAWLIVSGVLTVLVALFAFIGARRLKRFTPPTQSSQSITETVAWAKSRAGKADS